MDFRHVFSAHDAPAALAVLLEHEAVGTLHERALRIDFVCVSYLGCAPFGRLLTVLGLSVGVLMLIIVRLEQLDRQVLYHMCFLKSEASTCV